MTERVKKRIPFSWGTGLPWRVKSAFIFHLHSWGASRELEETHAWLHFAHQWHCVMVLFWSKGVHVDILALDFQDSLTVVQYSCFLPAVTDSAQDLPTLSRVGPTALSRGFLWSCDTMPKRQQWESPRVPCIVGAAYSLSSMEKSAPLRSNRIRCEVCAVEGVSVYAYNSASGVCGYFLARES